MDALNLIETNKLSSKTLVGFCEIDLLEFLTQDSDSDIGIFDLLDPSVHEKVVGNISISCSVEIHIMVSGIGSSSRRRRDRPQPRSSDKGKQPMEEGMSRRKKRAPIITIQDPGFRLISVPSADVLATLSRPCRERHTPSASETTIPETQPDLQVNEDGNKNTQGHECIELGAESEESTDDDGDPGVIVGVLEGPLDPRVRYRVPDGRWLIWPSDGFNGYRPSKSGSSSISRVIMENYKQAWPTWGIIKKDEKLRKMMWNSFKEKCAWNEEKYDDCLMETIFHSKASQRLRDMLAKAKKRDAKPYWMKGPIWEELKKHWEKVEYKKISEINKKNRASETGGTLHIGGSISTAEHKARMEFDAGKPVGLPKVHRALHFRKDGQPVDEQSRRLQEEYQIRLTQHQSQTRGPRADPADNSNLVSQVQIEHEAWMETTGGVNKKGRIPGAGNLAPCYRDLTASSSSRSCTGCLYVHDQALMSELQRKLEEESKVRSQLEAKMAEMKTKMREKLDLMGAQQRMILELLQGRGATTPPPTPNHTHRSPPRPNSMPYIGVSKNPISARARAGGLKFVIRMGNQVNMEAK